MSALLGDQLSKRRLQCNRTSLLRCLPLSRPLPNRRVQGTCPRADASLCHRPRRLLPRTVCPCKGWLLVGGCKHELLVEPGPDSLELFALLGAQAGGHPGLVRCHCPHLPREAQVAISCPRRAIATCSVAAGEQSRPRGPQARNGGSGRAISAAEGHRANILLVQMQLCICPALAQSAQMPACVAQEPPPPATA